MKKLFKIIISCLMIVGFAGCSESESYSAQETVINNLFATLSDGDMERMMSYCTEDNNDFDSFLELVEEIEQLEDVDSYGDVFVNRTKEFAGTYFKELIDSYVITSIEENDDCYIAYVDAKIKNYGDALDSIDYDELYGQYIVENEDVLNEILFTDGFEAAIETLLADFVSIVYDDMEETIKNAELIDMTYAITLIPSEDGYLVSSFE